MAGAGLLIGLFVLNFDAGTLRRDRAANGMGTPPARRRAARRGAAARGGAQDHEKVTIFDCLACPHPFLPVSVSFHGPAPLASPGGGPQDAPEAERLVRRLRPRD